MQHFAQSDGQTDGRRGGAAIAVARRCAEALGDERARPPPRPPPTISYPCTLVGLAACPPTQKNVGRMGHMQESSYLGIYNPPAKRARE